MEKELAPWINDRCKKAIQEKARAEDTDKYEKMNERCSEILREERQKYIDKLKLNCLHFLKVSLIVLV